MRGHREREEAAHHVAALLVDLEVELHAHGARGDRRRRRRIRCAAVEREVEEAASYNFV